MESFIVQGADAVAREVDAKQQEAATLAWQQIAQPVTEASFTAWYLKHVTAPKRAGAKRVSEAPPSAAKKARAQAPLPGASALTKGARTALLRSVCTTLKANIKAKKPRWHRGDRETIAGTSVMARTDFAALARSAFPDVALTTKGVTTTFSLPKAKLAAVEQHFKMAIATWSRPRRGSFRKAWKTGLEPIELVATEGKYSTGTSTMTLKVQVRVAGGYQFDESAFGFHSADY